MPRITEKAAFLGEQGVYAFDISPRATKNEVARAVQEVYSVAPRKVTLVHVPSKRRRNRDGSWGASASGKKAYVFLKKGDKIELA